MRHRIIRFDFTDDAFSIVGDRRDAESLVLPSSFAESMTSAREGYSSAPLFESDPMVATVREELAGIDGVTEADITSRYTLARTQAPAEGDGFGTLSGPTIDGWRIVAVKPEHFEWQAMRYESGCYAFSLGEAA